MPRPADVRVSFGEARRLCERWESYVVLPTSHAEQTYLLEKFRPHPGQSFWIAATGLPHSDQFIAVDSRSLKGFANWKFRPTVNEEDTCFAATYDAAGIWTPMPCAELNSVICERPVTYDIPFVAGDYSKEYHFSTERAEYMTAQHQCKVMQAKLAIIANSREHDWIQRKMENDVWVGGRKAADNTWVWSNGEIITKWDDHGGLPQAECLLANGLRTSLQARPCGEKHYFLCERTKIYIGFLNEAVLDIESRLEKIESFAQESREEFEATRYHVLSYFNNATLAGEKNATELETLEMYLLEIEEQIRQVNRAHEATKNQTATTMFNDKLANTILKAKVNGLVEEFEKRDADQKRFLVIGCVVLVWLFLLTFAFCFNVCSTSIKISRIMLADRQYEFRSRNELPMQHASSNV